MKKKIKYIDFTEYLGNLVKLKNNCSIRNIPYSIVGAGCFCFYVKDCIMLAYKDLRVDVLGLTSHALALLLGCYHSDITRVEKPMNRRTSNKARKSKKEDRKEGWHRPSVKGVHNSFTIAFYSSAKWDPNLVVRAQLHDMNCLRRKKPLDVKTEVPIIVNIARRVMPRPEFDDWHARFTVELKKHLEVSEVSASTGSCAQADASALIYDEDRD